MNTQRIFENSTFSLDYDREQNLIIQNWFGDLTNDQYKANMLIFVDWILKLPLIQFNIVYPDLNFPIVPDLQDWTKENVFMVIGNKGLKKVAFIIPQYVFEQITTEFISIEQTMEENPNLFETRYFSSEKAAQEWFNQE